MLSVAPSRVDASTARDAFTQRGFIHTVVNICDQETIYKAKSLVILNIPHMKHVCTSITWQNIGGHSLLRRPNQIIGGHVPLSRGFGAYAEVYKIVNGLSTLPASTFLEFRADTRTL